MRDFNFAYKKIPEEINAVQRIVYLGGKKPTAIPGAKDEAIIVTFDKKKLDVFSPGDLTPKTIPLAVRVCTRLARQRITTGKLNSECVMRCIRLL